MASETVLAASGEERDEVRREHRYPEVASTQALTTFVCPGGASAPRTHTLRPLPQSQSCLCFFTPKEDVLAASRTKLCESRPKSSSCQRYNYFTERNQQWQVQRPWPVPRLGEGNGAETTGTWHLAKHPSDGVRANAMHTQDGSQHSLHSRCPHCFSNALHCP